MCEYGVGDDFVVYDFVILRKCRRFLWISRITDELLFSAHPVAAYWNTPPELIGTQFVLDVPNLVIACAAVDIFLDIAVLSLPFPVIKGLHMPTEKKLYVSGVFLLGAL